MVGTISDSSDELVLAAELLAAYRANSARKDDMPAIPVADLARLTMGNAQKVTL